MASPYGTKPNQLAQLTPQEAPVSAPPPAALQANPPQSAVPAGLDPNSQALNDPAAVPTQMGPAPLPLTPDMKSYGDYLASHGQNPSDISQYLQYLSSHQESDLPSPDDIKQSVGDIVKSAPAPDKAAAVTELEAKALDYGGGIVRGGLAEVAGAAQGKSIVTEKDLDDIFHGKGPNSAEYLKRLGVNEGVSGTIPIIGKKVSQRDVEGFVADVITDPLTILGKAAKTLPEGLETLRSVLGLGANEGAEAIGKAIYKSGFSKIDAKMIEKGQRPLSEVLIQEANLPAGTTSSVAKKVNAIAETMGKMRDGLYEKATANGASIDLAYKDTTSRAQEYIQKLASDKRADVRSQAAELQNYLQRNYIDAGKVDLATLSQWKTDLYNTLPKNFFDANGRMSPVGKQFNAILAEDFRQAIVESGNMAEKGLGTSIDAINSKWGTLLNAKKPIAQQVKQAAGKPLVSPLKAAVTAHNPVIGAVLEGAELANTTAVRTGVGKTLHKAGKSGVAGDIVRRKAINATKDSEE